MELGGNGGAHEAAKIQDEGDFLGFHLLSLAGGEEIQIQVRRQKVCGQGRTPGRRGGRVQEVAALLFRSPVASENILYHMHSWLSTNSKAIFIIVSNLIFREGR